VTQASPPRSLARQKLIDTAIDLFSRHGARRVTVGELCGEAGVSKVTFYKYFANKADLVQTIHDDWSEAAFAAFDEINARDIPFPAKIDLMTRWKMTASARLGAAFIRELIDVEHTVDEAKRRYIANHTGAQANGELRPDIDPELMWLFGEAVSEMIHTGRWRAVSDDLGEFQRQVRTLLYYGFLTRDEEETP
jgi:AcrR family transcriptional regulator